MIAGRRFGLVLGLLAAAGATNGSLGPAWWAGLAAGCVLLGIEHRIVRPGDYRRMATAFFRMNALFGLAVLAATLADLFLLS